MFANSCLPSLGHTNAPASATPAEAHILSKLAKGEKVSVDELVPGLAWSLDFSENMGEIIKVNGKLSLFLSALLNPLI